MLKNYLMIQLPIFICFVLVVSLITGWLVMTTSISAGWITTLWFWSGYLWNYVERRIEEKYKGNYEDD